MSVPDAPVLFDELQAGQGRRIGVATLNAERSLNALTLVMVESLRSRLLAWERDPSIACVVLRGQGDKALCAGGDVVRLSRSASDGDEYAPTFFEQEYRLDYQIHTCSKPVVVWGHGVVMGGGLGILAGGSHRVVTEQTRMAMPEITIGLYPDVGATFFLQRTPGRTGLFLALTGASINAADALFAGFADRYIEHNRYPQLLAALQRADWESAAAATLVSRLLRELERDCGDSRPESRLREHYDWIQSVTDGDDVAQRVEQITGYSGGDPWLRQAATTLAGGCPMTIGLIDQQFRRGRHLSLREAFQLELIISCNCALRPNFREGVRALLIDKDRCPNFHPATLQAVSQSDLDAHFQPPWGDAPHPLADL